MGKTQSVEQLSEKESLLQIAKKAGIARTVLYRLLYGEGCTISSAAKLSDAYPGVTFNIDGKRYTMRRVKGVA